MTNKYEYRYRKQFYGEDGKRHDIKARTEEELKRKEFELRQKIAGENKVLLRDYTEKCIDNTRNMRDITRKKYELRLEKCVFSELGNPPVADVTQQQIQRTIDKQAGKSQTQVNDIFNYFKWIFNNACIDGLRIDNPAINIRKPSTAPRNKRRALTDRERAAVRSCAATERRLYVFLLMLECGCRPEEARNCMGADIILEDDGPYLHIRGSKSANANRYVDIPENLYELIKNTPRKEYIAITKNGYKVAGSFWERAWSTLKRKMNIYLGCMVYRNQLIPPYPLAEDIVPYDFRHDFATRAAEEAIDIRDVQVLMGHSDVKLTANIYTNLDKMDTAKRAKRLRKNRHPEDESEENK